jgi:hypothetical protein
LLATGWLILAPCGRLIIETLWTACGSAQIGRRAVTAGPAAEPRVAPDAPGPELRVGRCCRRRMSLPAWSLVFSQFFAASESQRCNSFSPAWRQATPVARGFGRYVRRGPVLRMAGTVVAICPATGRHSQHVRPEQQGSRRPGRIGQAARGSTGRAGKQAARRRSGKQRQDEPPGPSQWVRRGQHRSGAMRPARPAAFAERLGRTGFTTGESTARSAVTWWGRVFPLQVQTDCIDASRGRRMPEMADRDNTIATGNGAADCSAVRRRR